MSGIKKLYKLEKVEEVGENIPNGVYPGIWGGYVVEFTVNGVQYKADTKDGVRGMNCRCSVSVHNGKIDVIG